MKAITFERLLNVINPDEDIFVTEQNGKFNTNTKVSRFGEAAKKKYGQKEVVNIYVLKDGRLGITIK